jgi:hypothetical protein
MKKKLILLIALYALMGVTLMACVESSANEPISLPEPTPIESEAATPETIPQGEELAPDEEDIPDDAQEVAETYTIEQIQIALQPQFQVGDWGEGNPQVISVQRVEREVDSFFWESADSYIDLSDAVRYQVIVRFRQSIEDYTMWSEMWADSERNPFSRDGDYSILTDYYHFHDVNGNPELVVVMC